MNQGFQGRSPKPSIHTAILVAVALAASACATLEDRIAEPRGRSMLSGASAVQFETGMGITRGQFQVPSGPLLEYRLVEPRTYDIQYRYVRTDEGVKFGFNAGNSADERLPVPVKGTVVLVHGWGMDGSSMLHWALALAEHGWRGIAIDLRNHGTSGRAPAGFGPREGGDIAALVSALRESGEIDGPLALFGVSYGAVASLYAAAELGADQVDAVVAMAPYANAADGIRDMIGGMKAMPSLGVRSQLLRTYARARYDQARIDRAIRTAGRRLDVDLANVDVRVPAAGFTGCMILLHGTEDGFFPMEVVQSLAEVSPRGQLVALEGEHHFTAPMRVDWLAEPIAEWLDAAAAGCRPFVLPSPPPADS
ncbi:alpha/beta fold hydrolase [Luteimonas sp. A277]